MARPTRLTRSARCRICWLAGRLAGWLVSTARQEHSSYYHYHARTWPLPPLPLQLPLPLAQSPSRFLCVIRICSHLWLPAACLSPRSSVQPLPLMKSTHLSSHYTAPLHCATLHATSVSAHGHVRQLAQLQMKFVVRTSCTRQPQPKSASCPRLAVERIFLSTCFYRMQCFSFICCAEHVCCQQHCLATF